MMQTINLLARDTGKNRLSAIHLIALILLSLLVAAAVSLWQYHTTQQNQRALAASEADLEAAQSTLEQFRQDHPEVADNSRLESRIESLQEERATRRELLSNIERNTGLRNFSYYEFMAALASQRVDGVWLTRFSLTNTEQNNQLAVTLTGQAEEADLLPQYLDRLRASGMGGLSFNDLRLNRLTDGDSDGLYSFNMRTRAREQTSQSDGERAR